jgi:hypothetical protein
VFDGEQFAATNNKQSAEMEKESVNEGFTL